MMIDCNECKHLCYYVEYDIDGRESNIEYCELDREVFPDECDELMLMKDCPNNCEHYCECNHTDRYDYNYDGVIDYQTEKEYKSYKDIAGLLNQKEDKIKELKDELFAVTSSVTAPKTT